MKNNKSFAIVIVGATCVGKSTIARAIAHKYNLPLISEEVFGSYFGVLDNINPDLYPKCIYEHCDLVKKHFMFKKLYDKTLFIFLKASHELLRSNFQKRIEMHSTGDYVKIDPVKQQEEINTLIDQMKEKYVNKDHLIQMVYIENTDEYNQALQKIDSHIKEFID